MWVDRMNSALADEANEVHSALRALRALACTDERFVSEETPVGDPAIDPHEILHHDASGPEIQMPDFTVADLMFRQSNRQTRSREQRSWIAPRERIPGRRLRQGNRITITFGAIPPAVENDQYYR